MANTEAPKYISRLTLIKTLDYQYRDKSPFFIEKDGKDEYDYTRDRLHFICCSNMDHKHYMTPLQILQLRYIYGMQPCPICFKKHGGRPENKLDASGGEDVSDIVLRKKYMESDDPQENAKREADVQNELDRMENEWKKKLNKRERNRPQRTRQENEPEESSVINEEETTDEPVVESMSYEDYIKNKDEIEKEIGVENSNNDLNEEPIVESTPTDEIEEPIVESVPTNEVEDDEPIVESISYDEYIGNEVPEENSSVPEDDPDYDEILKYGNEEGSEYSSMFLKESNGLKKDEEYYKGKTPHIGARGRVGHNSDNKEEILYKIENPIEHQMYLKAKEEYENAKDNPPIEDIPNEEKSTEESNYSNQENTNILLNEEKMVSESSDEEEEDIDFDKY